MNNRNEEWTPDKAWTTDRKPTSKDAPNGYVWTTTNDRTGFSRWDAVKDGVPWMPMIWPQPYEKPMRFWPSQEFDGTFSVEKRGPNTYFRVYRLGLPTFEAAKEVAEVFERVMP